MFQAGQKVILKSAGGLCIKTVERTTKKLVILTDGSKYRLENGRDLGKDKWYSSSISPATDEDIKAIVEANKEAQRKHNEQIEARDKQDIEKFNQYKHLYEQIQKEPNTIIKIVDSEAFVRVHKTQCSYLVFAVGFRQSKSDTEKEYPPSSFSLREDSEKLEVAFGRLFAELERKI